MKRLLNFFGNVAYVLMLLWEIAEVLALPALFIAIGIINNHSWEFYAITIGGYFLVIIIVQLILDLIFKALKKKYTPIFIRIVNGIADVFLHKKVKRF